MSKWLLSQMLGPVSTRSACDALRAACPRILDIFEQRGIPASEVGAAVVESLPAALSLRFDECLQRARPEGGHHAAEILSVVELLSASGSTQCLVVGARVLMVRLNASAAWRGEPQAWGVQLELALGESASTGFAGLTAFHYAEAEVHSG